jgi:segregation and condensation protein A
MSVEKAVLPADLYIPPDALEVILDMFSGPLDLLLYLIKKNNLNILDIPVAEITRQYLEYMELMQEFKLELAADYLEMAAFLMEIKSRLLLPQPKAQGGEEEDPRAELMRRLQEYERFRAVAQQLEALPQMERELWVAQVDASDLPQKILGQVALTEIVAAFQEILKRVDLTAMHAIMREPLSVRERMSRILSEVHAEDFVAFSQFFIRQEGKMGVVVTFLAILELVKGALIELIQQEPFGMIYIRAGV